MMYHYVNTSKGNVDVNKAWALFVENDEFEGALEVESKGNRVARNRYFR